MAYTGKSPPSGTISPTGAGKSPVGRCRIAEGGNEEYPSVSEGEVVANKNAELVPLRNFSFIIIHLNKRPAWRLFKWC
jgi:hypothetical protein